MPPMPGAVPRPEPPCAPHLVPPRARSREHQATAPTGPLHPPTTSTSASATSSATSGRRRSSSWPCTTLASSASSGGVPGRRTDPCPCCAGFLSRCSLWHPPGCPSCPARQDPAGVTGGRGTSLPKGLLQSGRVRCGVPAMQPCPMGQPVARPAPGTGEVTSGVAGDSQAGPVPVPRLGALVG